MEKARIRPTENRKKHWEELYKKDTKNKIREWEISVEEKDGKGYITVRHGLRDGKHIVSTKEISKGKNIGKKNETTPFEQAVAQAQSQYNKQLDKGYKVYKNLIVTNVENQSKENSTKKNEPTELFIRPMLAHDYTKRGKDTKFPCYIQPKLDGVRALVYKENGTIVVKSRQGKEYNNAEHIKKELASKRVFEIYGDDLILDGELYCDPDQLPFEELVGLCRRKTLKKGDQEKLKYIFLNLYDLFYQRKLTMDYCDRRKTIEKLEGFDTIKLVETKVMEDPNKLYENHARYLEQGYEGAILRNIKGVYKVNGRSVDLQKYKEFKDAEFKIIGFFEGTGNDAGTVVFECEYTKTDGVKSKFKCRPRGSKKVRSEMFENGESYKGKQLTVRYQDLTNVGCPRFPVGIVIRDYE